MPEPPPRLTTTATAPGAPSATACCGSQAAPKKWITTSTVSCAFAASGIQMSTGLPAGPVKERVLPPSSRRTSRSWRRVASTIGEGFCDDGAGAVAATCCVAGGRHAVTIADTSRSRSEVRFIPGIYARRLGGGKLARSRLRRLVACHGFAHLTSALVFPASSTAFTVTRSGAAGRLTVVWLPKTSMERQLPPDRARTSHQRASSPGAGVMVSSAPLTATVGAGGAALSSQDDVGAIARVAYSGAMDAATAPPFFVSVEPVL